MSQSASQFTALTTGRKNHICRRFALAAIVLLCAGASAAQAATISTNTGSLGSAANGANANSVTSGPGAVTAGGDLAAVYDGVAGTNTTIPFQSALNPASGSPFSVEF